MDMVNITHVMLVVASVTFQVPTWAGAGVVGAEGVVVVAGAGVVVGGGVVAGVVVAFVVVVVAAGVVVSGPTVVGIGRISLTSPWQSEKLTIVYFKYFISD
jgi:hypothetical protein